MKRIAHRGLHGGSERPPNSPAAIRAAWSSPADGLEIDLQMLGDGRIVTHHDPVLQTPPGQEGRHRALADLTLEAFRRLSPVPAMVLPELLEGTPDHQRLILECKPQRSPSAFRRRLLRVLQRQETPPGTLLSSGELHWLEELAPTAPVPLAPVVHRFGARERRALRGLDWREIHLWEGLCSEDVLNRLREHRDRPVIAWTVNDPGRADELETLGVEGIMTDRPDLLGASGEAAAAGRSPSEANPGR